MPRTLVALSALTLCTFGIALSLTRPATAEPGQTPRPAKNFKLLPGFQAELLYTVPRNQQGSWVNMTFDPKGRIITSDQGGKLYRVTVAPAGDTKTPIKVEQIQANIGQAHGLLCAFGNLYVVVNGGAAQGSGLYRVSDSNGDDQYDKVELLLKLQGAGEHGPHGVVVAPDGKSLLFVAGNFTVLPNIESSLVPRNWGEDHLLGRLPDARGHDPRQMAPGGWICRVDPDGKHPQLYASGFRNAFDIALNPDKEVFTYDSDMEWDIGLPWYRPTRINHVASGAENGWRNGSGKWPTYYPDSLPPVVDIGFGSPTGVTFGTGAKFPAKYQQALYASDWSYGQIYAVHLTPKGSSYSGTFETFAAASPLPVTDIAIGPNDGAMYFTVGGRGTDSALYRITYTGKELTAPVSPVADAAAQQARELRHKLEALHVAGAPGAVETAWPYLADPDLYLRYAARVAIEHQPVASWKEKALAEKKPEALITAMVALARCGDKADQKAILESLGRVKFDSLSELDKIALLRAYGLTFIRQGKPEAAQRDAVIAQIDSHYPAATYALNRELGTVLSYLEAPKAIDRTLKLLAAAPTQEEQIQYVFELRNAGPTWTTQQRKDYFTWFLRAGQQRGGASFEGFVNNIRTEAMGHLTTEERQSIKRILDTPIARNRDTNIGPPRKLVKEWKLDELLRETAGLASGRNFANGEMAFTAASCIKCHRFSGNGGIVGPDLTGVGRRFSPRDILESIVLPDKVISDQYQATIFDLKNGKTVVGRVANMHDDKLMIMTEMLDPSHFTTIRRGDVEESRPSTVSMMPGGLLNSFTRDEILDLVAYLRSGGNSTDPAFAKAASTAASK